MSFPWLTSLLTGASAQQETDIYDALLQALGPELPTEQEQEVPVFTQEDVDAFGDFGLATDWLDFLNPGANVSQSALEIPIGEGEPQFNNFVIAKDIFDFDTFGDSFVPGETITEEDTGIARTRKKAWSNYFITINTNRKPSPDRAYAQASEFRNWLVNYVFTNDMYRQVLVLNGGADTYDTDSVQNISTIVVVEVGGKQNRLHAHVLMNIEHTSNVLVDYPRFKALCDANPHEPSIRGYYINWQLGRDKNFVIQYMAKQTVRALQTKALGQREPSLERIVRGG